MKLFDLYSFCATGLNTFYVSSKDVSSHSGEPLCSRAKPRCNVLGLLPPCHCYTEALRNASIVSRKYLPSSRTGSCFMNGTEIPISSQRLANGLSVSLFSIPFSGWFADSCLSQNILIRFPYCRFPYCTREVTHSSSRFTPIHTALRARP